jgi:myosin-1
VEFAYTVTQYDRKFKTQKRDLILTGNAIVIVGREKEKAGPKKGQFVEIITRQIDFEQLQSISLRYA